MVTFLVFVSQHFLEFRKGLDEVWRSQSVSRYISASGATMLIDKETYDYSDLEQILLRRYVLGNTIRVIKPSIEECINNLGLRDSNITNSTNRIYDAWKALKEKGYIDSLEKKVREKEWRKKKIYQHYFEVIKTPAKNASSWKPISWQQKRISWL